MESLNYIDVAIVALVTALSVKGLIRGLFRESVGLLGLIAALLLAVRFLSDVTAVVRRALDLSPAVSMLISFVLLFAAFLAAFQILANLLHKLIQKTSLSWMERVAGGLVGFLKGAVIASLLALFLTYLPAGETLAKERQNSMLFGPTREFAPWLFDQLQRLAPGAKSFYEELRDSMQRKPPSEASQSIWHSTLAAACLRDDG